MSLRLRLAGAACLAALLLVPSVDATTVVHLSPRELGQDASVVARGTVVSVESRWNRNQSRILTTTTVAVDETYKGRSDELIRIVQLGGTVGNVRMTVSGALSWSVDEEVLLFLEDARENEYRVAGFSQGRYEVERDPRTGLAYVSRAVVEGLEYAKKLGQAEPSDPISSSTRIALEEFLATALEQ